MIMREVIKMSNQHITQNALKNTLKNLMIKKPINKISIKEICEICQINRKTFYYHFDDKFELLNWVFYSECIETLKDKNIETFYDAFEHIVRKIYESQEFYANAFKIPPGQHFGNTVMNSFQEYVVQQFIKLLKKYSDPIHIKPLLAHEEDMRVHFYNTAAGSLMGNIQEGLLYYPNYNADQALEMMRNVFFRYGKKNL